MFLLSSHAEKACNKLSFTVNIQSTLGLITRLVLYLVLMGLLATSLAAEPPWEKPEFQEPVNHYPETREEIDAYKEYVIRKHHEEISDYPEEVIHISSLEELFHYAGESGVHVRMKPGVYSIGADNMEELWAGEKGDSYSETPTDLQATAKDYDAEFETGQALLTFSGDHSYYDLRGVTIRMDTYVNHTLPFWFDVGVDGDHMILEGLTVRMIGNHVPTSAGEGERMFEQAGDNNLFHNLKLVARGSVAYGFGDGKMTTGMKKSAFRAGGQNNRYVGLEIYQRASGHALFWKPAAVRTFIDCHIEGEKRLIKDILRGRPTGAFYSLPPGKGVEDVLPEDELKRMRSAPAGATEVLSENAYRSYMGLQERFKARSKSELKVLGGTVKNVRSSFYRGASTTEFLSNVKNSTTAAPRVATRNHVKHYKNVSEIHLGTQRLLRFGDSGGTSGYEAYLTVMPEPSDTDPEPKRPTSGRIFPDTSHHKAVLRAGDGLEPEHVKQARKDQPLVIAGDHHYVRNETGVPVKLTEQARKCRIVTNGQVIDNGEGNTVKKLENKDLERINGIESIDGSAPEAEEAVPKLIDVVENGELVGVAAKALGRIGPGAKEAVPVLKRAANRYPALKNTIQSALSKIER